MKKHKARPLVSWSTAVSMLAAGIITSVVTAAGCANASAGATCGNGVVEGDEECDDNNLINGDGCSAMCFEEPVCGNHICEAVEDTQNCPEDCLACSEQNGCGGCEILPGEPGDACGACGVYACDGIEAVTCDDPGVNACGGCAILAGNPDDACGDCGVYACDGLDAVVCGDPGLNCAVVATS